MLYWNEFQPEKMKDAGEHLSCTLLDAEQGCVDDCMAGISEYAGTEYSPAQKHPFQEGFYVISGAGSARIGEEEFPVHEGMTFLAPRETLHTIKSSGAEPVRVFWFHCT